jgi:plastocyanin
MAAAHAAVTTHDVTVDDNEYRPAEVTINVGDSVRWRNVGLTRHSVTFRSGTSSELLPTQTAVQRFDNPGTYLYFCRDHEDEMKGTVLVRGTAGSTNRSTTITTEPPAGSARTGAPEESTTTTSSTTTTVADDGGTTTTMSEGSAARRPSGVDSDSDGGPNVDAPRQSPPCSSWPQAGPRS